MNNLTIFEAEYLQLMNPHLKDGNRQVIINILRQYVAADKANKGFDSDRGGYQGDTNWSDEEIHKGKGL